MMTRIKTDKEIEAMRISGQMLAKVLEVLLLKIAAGMTTKELADMAAKELSSLGGKPAFLGYQGFPDVICISINDEVVHGIPNNHKVLLAGDIVGMDFGVIYNGMITDGAVSAIVDRPASARDKVLLDITKQSMMAGIGVLKHGVRIGDIGQAVEDVLKLHKLGIVRDLVGHGVGHQLHEDPNIPNYGLKGTGQILKAGMTIAIEPMATLGGEDIYIDSDQWTVKTRDRSRSAHFENTVLITNDGFEILTSV
jgi:methionyl aminopeptidase